ncbi:hypothetical protein [Pseudoroseicyclus sp. CXY001]|uniref:hypothetical protein n=1 Tax=Pseudoroseicyclus sp. CXY001 TaxID=3242492 RepID=UPI0035709832
MPKSKSTRGKSRTGDKTPPAPNQTPERAASGKPPKAGPPKGVPQAAPRPPRRLPGRNG